MDNENGRNVSLRLGRSKIDAGLPTSYIGRPPVGTAGDYSLRHGRSAKLQD